MNDGRIKVSKPWNPAISPTLCRILDELGIRFDLVTRVEGALLVVEVDPEGDAKVVALWDEISDLRARYIDARQRSLATQTTFLKERA